MVSKFHNGIHDSKERENKITKTCVKRPLIKKHKDLNYKWYLNESRKYCRMLPLQHYAIRLTCIKRSLLLKSNFWTFWERPFYTGFAIHYKYWLTLCIRMLVILMNLIYLNSLVSDVVIIVATLLVIIVGSTTQIFAASTLRGLRFFQILRMVRIDRKAGSWKLLASVVWAHRRVSLFFLVDLAHRKISLTCCEIRQEGGLMLLLDTAYCENRQKGGLLETSSVCSLGSQKGTGFFLVRIDRQAGSWKLLASVVWAYRTVCLFLLVGWAHRNVSIMCCKIRQKAWLLETSSICSLGSQKGESFRF